MNNKEFIVIMENDFSVHEHEDGVELETWTTGGVNMIISLQNESDETYYEQFKEYVKEFEIDEEIELHRQDDRYRSAFTIRESLEDFEEFHKDLKALLV